MQAIDHINGKSIGIIFMSFGLKARNSIRTSIASLKSLGYDYPVYVVDESIWKGNDPYDKTQRKNFHFRAGRIKPFLYDYSPFDYTLYIDADTRFLKPIHQGFELLDQNDIAVTEEILSLKDLYNKKLAGWELNLIERDATIIELGGNDTQKFINSGVFFFKKNDKVKKLFGDWAVEWQRFQEWDEQLALMRAIGCNNLTIKYLPVEWNSPHMKENTIIFHMYGRGVVRVNK